MTPTTRALVEVPPTAGFHYKSLFFFFKQKQYLSRKKTPHSKIEEKNTHNISQTREISIKILGYIQQFYAQICTFTFYESGCTS